MAKSNIINVNQKISRNTKKVYSSIRNATVGSYKKIEDSATGFYQKIEDWFVDRYLTHDGETIEDAKQRIKNSNF